MDTTTGGKSLLLGRDDDLAVVSAAMSRVGQGTAQIVLVEGEAGIGKSALARTAVDAAPAGMKVLHGHGHELERERPFGLVLDALTETSTPEPELEQIQGLLRIGDPAEPTGDDDFAVLRFRVIETIIALIDRWTQQTPVLLVLEDVHWADPSSLLAIGQVARRLPAQPFGVLATLRPSPRAAGLETLRRELSPEAVLRCRLGPLAATAVHDLAVRSLGATPGPQLLELLTGAGGNPFFITELLAALADDDALGRGADGRAELTSPEPPASLRLTILRRLGFLPPRTLETLRTAGVLGSRFHLDDLSVVLDRPATDLLRDLEEARLSGFLAMDGTHLSFRHDLVRSAIYEDLPVGVRRALHIQSARRLSAAGRDATAVATHFLAGASPGDAEAIGWLERAGRDALSSAPGVAATLLTAAVELASERPADRDRIEVELATALTWAGRLDDAERLLEDLILRPHDHAVDARIRLALLRVLMIQGRAMDAVQRCDELDARSGLDGRQQARAYTDAATARLLGGDVEGARRDAQRGLDLGRELDDDPAICGALSALSWVANLRGNTAEAIDLGEQAVALATTSPVHDTGRRYPHCYLAVVLVDADRLEDGAHMYDVGRRLAEAYGDTWQLPIHHWGAVLASFYAGRFHDTDAGLEAAFELLDEVGTGMLQVWAHALSAHVAIRQDDLDTAETHLAAAERRIELVGPGMGADWLLWGRALLHEANGEVAQAAAMLKAAWDLAGALGIVSQRRLIGPDLVRLLIADGDVEVARNAAEAMADVAELSGIVGARTAALRCRALVDGDPAAALQAIDLQRDGPRRVELADTCRDAAGLYTDVGDDDRARDLLREAATLYHEAGAIRDEHQVDAQLRALGVARGRRGARGRPKTGWESLTPTEVEVTRLVAEGLTNPEVGRRLFISPRTVETHLTHVFGKLGVASRVELATEVARRTH